MWPTNFEHRLASWHSLRQRAATAPIPQCLQSINQWWTNTPWQPYYLHWHDRSAWPDPWQLLADNFYCDLARALGMLYTIALIDRPDIQDARIAETELGNLVLVHGEKYILNWDRDIQVNNNLEHKIFPNQLSQVEVRQQI